MHSEATVSLTPHCSNRPLIGQSKEKDQSLTCNYHSPRLTVWLWATCFKVSEAQILHLQNDSIVETVTVGKDLRDKFYINSSFYRLKILKPKK